MSSTIDQIRKDYSLHSLTEAGVAASPVEQFTRWWDQAIESKIDEVNAMTLSTINAQGLPESRIVLLKGYSEKGFIFFTNYESDKGSQLHQQPHCSLLFFWKELERQVRINGKAEKISSVESDTYFNSRPEGSKIGAWASPQSRPVESQQWLLDNYEHWRGKYENRPIPRPPHWGGWLVLPALMEFWQGRPSRMHDRIRYKVQPDGSWKTERLAP